MREDIKKRIEQIRWGEVPAGYTRTKEGVLPLEWKEKRLGQLADVIMGQSPSSKYYNTNKKGKPLIQGNNDRTDRESDPKVWTTQITKECKTGDILLSVRAPVGTVFRSRHNACIGRGICAIRSAYSDYLFQFLIFHEDRWGKNAQGSTFESINRNEIESKDIPFCERDYLKISEILSTCDKVIELKKKLVEEKKKVKKWLMQTLLTGMIRVKDIENGTPYEELKKRIDQIRNGQIPEGYEKKRNVGIFPVDWELQRLVKYADKVVDGTHATPKYVENGVPFYSVETITSNDFKNVKFISHEEHLRLSKRCKVEKGDILLTRIGTIGKTALVDWDEEGSIYVSLALIKISDQNLRSYFYEYSKSSLFVKEVLRKSLLLATPPKINMNDIEKVKLVISSSGVERTRIAEILSTADKEIDLLNKDLKQWELKKKSLMQLLLTGIVRVNAEN